MTPRSSDRWEESVGFIPHKVTAYENAQKGDVLYLRWRAGGNWKRKSLGVKLRDEKGRVLSHVRQMARDEAQKQYEILSGKLASAVAAETKLLTIGDTWRVITDPRTGLYPVQTAHRKEVERQIMHAARIWGPVTPWNVIDRTRLRELGRTRVDELRAAGETGYRGAEVCLVRVLAVAAWLRDEGHIAQDAAIAPQARAGSKSKLARWREELREYWRLTAGSLTDHEPKRPRHSLEEMRKILEKAPEVDPRFALLMALGAELRLGQVARCRRSDLDVTAATLTVRGAGKKKGTITRLTGGQMRAVRVALDGYLRDLEAALPDYPLFPQGQMTGGRSGNPVADPERHGVAEPIVPTAWRSWFREAEALAKVEHVPGRLAYGLRRAAVDAAKELGISREGLQAHGGWTDAQIPDRVYADQQMGYAQDEARDIRAKIRGESE